MMWFVYVYQMEGNWNDLQCYVKKMRQQLAKCELTWSKSSSLFFAESQFLSGKCSRLRGKGQQCQRKHKRQLFF